MDRSVTFESAEPFGGMGVCTGTVRLLRSEGAVHLEWQVKDSFVGVIKSGLKSRTVPVADIAAAQFKKGVVSSKIVLEGRSMSVFHDVPGAEGTTLRLPVPRRQRDAAQAFASELEVQLSEIELREATEGTDLPM